MLAAAFGWLGVGVDGDREANEWIFGGHGLCRLWGAEAGTAGQAEGVCRARAVGVGAQLGAGVRVALGGAVAHGHLGACDLQALALAAGLQFGLRWHGADQHLATAGDFGRGDGLHGWRVFAGGHCLMPSETDLMFVTSAALMAARRSWKRSRYSRAQSSQWRRAARSVFRRIH